MGSTSTSTLFLNWLNNLKKCHVVYTMPQPGLKRIEEYLSSTGMTGRPGAKAPLAKVSRQCLCLVVPSGATMNNGYLVSSERVS